MKFDVSVVKACLVNKNQVFTVRKYKTGSKFSVTEVCDIGSCMVEKIKQVESMADLRGYLEFSGFVTLKQWWDKIVSFGAQNGWLYHVTVLEDEFSSPSLPTESEFITSLAEDEVFVFGSNLNGFHGAGSAGYAMRGTVKNDWRTDQKFLDIKSGKNPDKRGKWAVFGEGIGFQEGLEGKSYAIATVERPGHQGSVTEEHLHHQLLHLVRFARDHPELKFRLVKLGANRAEGGYSYLGLELVNQVWNKIRASENIPSNIIFPGV